MRNSLTSFDAVFLLIPRRPRQMATPPPKPPRDAGSDDNESSSLSNSSEELVRRPKFEYFGWVYHLGVNKIGHEYCHLRFLFIRGKYVEMYKRDPHSNPGIKPIRRGIVGHTLMVEELGRRKFNSGDLYVLRFYNRLDESRKGEIACSTAGEVQQWMEAFDQAKQQAEYELLRGGSVREKLNVEDDFLFCDCCHPENRLPLPPCPEPLWVWQQT